MALGSAIGDLIQSVLDIFAAIVNTILAFVHAIYATVRGVITTAFHTVEGTVGLLWANIGLLLVVGFAILIYQVFVVDKGRAPAVQRKINNAVGQKKVR